MKQGNLFFSIADILDFHRPAAFVLENVKNLKGHDGGKTFEIIHRTLTEALGYTVYHKIIDAQSVVPQHRERIFFVGFREWRYFEFPQFPAEGPKLETILEPNPDPKYTLTDHLWTLPPELRRQTSGRRQWLRLRPRHRATTSPARSARATTRTVRKSSSRKAAGAIRAATFA